MIKTLHTDNAPAAIGPYSQAKIVNGILYASGQIAINPASGEIEADTIEGQTQQICENIGAILEAAGSDFSKVIKTTCFLKNMSDFSVFNGVYGSFFTSKPARSCVAAAALPKDALAEIEIIAEV
ncbi:MAG TPA: RidA family protein [Candidatus Fimenecus excrementigallinarum]|uniref:RidA family protein n=1 Tax=Candidatus Fimenecus excrementigallinarum TaxID=2840816 RepID=A0A9D1IDP4_9FIRM|nr:RidA family protein [Candidatus Fimenecus excrementigallinarum]